MTLLSRTLRRSKGRIVKVRNYIAQAGPVLVILAFMPLAGCTSLAVGAGATAGVAALQERGFGGAVSDTAITAEIWQKFLTEDENLFRRIEIEVVEGEVLLAGTVENTDSELKAVELAWQVNGVNRVINEINVGQGSSLMDSASDLFDHDPHQNRTDV